VSTPHGLPAPAPVVAPHSAEFWAATAHERLLVGHCPACDQWFWPPTRSFCPRCGGVASLREADGTGAVYSYTIVRVVGAIALGGGPYKDAVPYVLAYVELTEGPTVLTNIVGIDPDDVTIGLAVRVVFARTGGPEEPALPRFQPV
jgi:uncharacterized OB-fold protein